MRVLIRLWETTLPAQLQKRMSSIARWIADRIEAAAVHYAAATIYEQLSRLSDAELQRRGFAPETLQRNVSEAFRPPRQARLDRSALSTPDLASSENTLPGATYSRAGAWWRSGRYGPSPPAAPVRGLVMTERRREECGTCAA